MITVRPITNQKPPLSTLFVELMADALNRDGDYTRKLLNIK